MKFVFHSKCEVLHMEFKLRNAGKKSVWHEKFVAILIYYLSKKLNTVGCSGAKSKLSEVRNPDQACYIFIFARAQEWL